MELTQKELKKWLHYNPETGDFTWIAKAASNVAVGRVTGARHSRGYKAIGLHRKVYLAHRLAWLYTFGKVPREGIDHVNGGTGDNRLVNLRLANQSENCQNQYGPPAHNTSGFLGASYLKKRKKWRSYITKEGKYVHLGTYPTPEAAHQAYLNAKRELHPFGML